MLADFKAHEKDYLQGREPGAPIDNEHGMDTSLTHKLGINFPYQHYGGVGGNVFPLCKIGITA